MDQARVKELTKHIKGLREEMAGYSREVKRLKEEIEAYDMLRDEAIMETAKQTGLSLADTKTERD